MHDPRRAAQGALANCPQAAHRHLRRLPGWLAGSSSIWNSAGSGFVVRSRLDRVTTVWKPWASITVHCLSAIGRGVENERQMRRAAERRLVLDLDRDRIALLRDAEDPGVAGEVDVIGEQELERRLADEIFVLGVELAVDDGEAAAVGDDLEPRPCRTESAPGARGSASPPTAVRPARSERSRRS